MLKYCQKIFISLLTKLLERIELDYENLCLQDKAQNIEERLQKHNHKTIHEILPLEIFEIILKNLDYNFVKTARRTCKQWKEVIDGFKLVEAASCKIHFQNNTWYIFRLILFVFQQDVLP